MSAARPPEGAAASAARPPEGAPASYAHLQGVRVLDLGIITAGASTSALLADLGADVVKIEGPDYTDPFRQWAGRAQSEAWWNESPQFQATNRNKRSVCLNLKSEAGHALFMRLVEQSDLVVENFRVGVMARLGLSYEALRARNPRIILASISSQGQTGPKARNVSFGSTLESSSGMAARMTYEAGGMPHITGRSLNYPDQVVSLFAAGAIMSALVERRRTGYGAFLDISQREVSSFLIGDAMGAQGGREPPREEHVLEGLGKGADGQWIAWALPTRARDGAAALLGQPAGVRVLETWMSERPAAEAAARLRAAGAAAEVVVKAQGYSDDHAMRPVQSLARDTAGRQVKGLPMRLGPRDIQAYRPAAPLGAHNAGVVQQVAGVAPEEYGRLVDAGILSDHPVARDG